MSDEAIWKEGKTVSKIHEKAFNQVLKAAFPGETGQEKSYPVLKLQFEDESELSIFGLDKVDLKEGTPGYTDIGKFLESLAALNYKYFWGTDEANNILGFKTEPDIVGKRLYMKPEERKGKVGSEYEDKVFKSWIIEKIETVKTKLQGQEKSKPETKPAPEGLEEFLITALESGSKKLSDLWKESGKKFSIGQIRDSGLIKEDETKKEYYKLA